MNTKLELLKQLLGIDTLDESQDAILSHYINSATTGILNYLNTDTLDPKLEGIVVDYARYLYQNRDNVGTEKKVQGHRSIALETGIPESIRTALPLPRIKVVGVR